MWRVYGTVFSNQVDSAATQVDANITTITHRYGSEFQLGIGDGGGVGSHLHE